MEKEEAIALAKAMEISSQDPPKPIVPGLTPMDTEEVITIRIQPDVSFLQRFYVLVEGAQWLSGRVLDSRLKSRGFKPHQRHCVVGP